MEQLHKRYADVDGNIGFLAFVDVILGAGSYNKPRNDGARPCSQSAAVFTERRQHRAERQGSSLFQNSALSSSEMQPLMHSSRFSERFFETQCRRGAGHVQGEAALVRLDPDAGQTARAGVSCSKAECVSSLKHCLCLQTFLRLDKDGSVSAPQPVRQTWTVLRHDGSDHLGLCQTALITSDRVKRP